MAQLVARDFWEVEVAGSSPVTQTTFQGVAQLVARSVRDAEVVGSSPITLTIIFRGLAQPGSAHAWGA